MSRGARPAAGEAVRGGSAGGWRRTLAPAAVAAGVVAVLAAAAWSVAQVRGPGPAGPGELALDGGLLRVEQVTSAARPAMAMPGMGTDTDPVADGERRVSVDVTLVATGDDPLRYAVEDFRLRVPGDEPRGPHRSVLPGQELPAGTQLSGTLVFDVPVTARTGELSYAGDGATEVTLPAEQGAGAAPSSGGHASPSGAPSHAPDHGGG